MGKTELFQIVDKDLNFYDRISKVALNEHLNHLIQDLKKHFKIPGAMHAKSIVLFLSCLIICTQGSSTLQNVALNKPAYMSSQFSDRVPGNAVDGSFTLLGTTDQDCISTAYDGNPSPWWKVDLLQTYLISSVLIQTSGMVITHTLYRQVYPLSRTNQQDEMR